MAHGQESDSETRSGTNVEPESERAREYEYAPGVCNIGSGERRKRYALAVASLFASIVVVAVVATLELSPWWLAAIVFPLYGTALGYLQGHERFCVGYAAQGLFDVGEGPHQITDPQALETDRRRAVRLNLKAVAIAVVGTVAVTAVGLTGF